MKTTTLLISLLLIGGCNISIKPPQSFVYKDYVSCITEGWNDKYYTICKDVHMKGEPRKYMDYSKVPLNDDCNRMKRRIQEGIKDEMTLTLYQNGLKKCI